MLGLISRLLRVVERARSSTRASRIMLRPRRTTYRIVQQQQQQYSSADTEHIYDVPSSQAVADAVVIMFHIATVEKRKDYRLYYYCYCPR